MQETGSIPVEDIAAVCHEANRALCATQLDFSQPPWVEAPDWQRSSAIQGVTAIQEARVTLPSQSHESWMAEKVANGWKYGPVKDPDKKEHPCIVPYGELPEHQRRKDYLFMAIVRALSQPIA